MRKSLKLITAVVVAGAAFAGVSAFTASNTFQNPVGVSGYGQDVTTGAVITSVTTTPLSTDNSKVDHVTFVSSTDLTDKTVSMTLKDSSTSTVLTPYPCSYTPYAAHETTITCPTGDHPGLAGYDTTGLTVV